MWTLGKVLSRYDWNANLFSLRLQVNLEPYQAGQFIKLSQFNAGRRITRAYSLVNPPHRDTLEVLAVTVPEGELSPNLHLLRPGDEIDVSTKAAGFLTLEEVPEGRDLWLLATGTGVGPFLSILATDAPWQRFERIILVYGVRYNADLSYLSQIQQWQQHYSQFTFVPIVTREQHPSALNTRIPEALTSGILEAHCNLTLSASYSQVMLCGNPAMISHSQAILLEKGLSKHLRRKPGHISVERYW